MTVDTIQLRRNPQCVYPNDLFEWASKAGLSQVVPSHCLDQAKMEAGDLNSHPTNVVPLFMAGVPAQIRPPSPRGPRCSPECIEIDDDDDDDPAMHWEYDDDAEY